MNILWIFAHPDQDSLNSALRDEGLAPLTEAGHSHRVSDLYAMGWKPTLDRGDLDHDDPAGIGRASGHAYDRGTLSEDITAEQEKLDWADAVVFQFPLWWYAPPAILKGWIDRVFVKGYAYGVTDPDHPGRTLRYGEGVLSGKRALVLTSIGGPEPAFGPRGINGQLDQVLFPLLHGTFWYTGMSVSRPSPSTARTAWTTSSTAQLPTRFAGTSPRSERPVRSPTARRTAATTTRSSSSDRHSHPIIRDSQSTPRVSPAQTRRDLHDQNPPRQNSPRQSSPRRACESGDAAVLPRGTPLRFEGRAHTPGPRTFSPSLAEEWSETGRSRQPTRASTDVASALSASEPTASAPFALSNVDVSMTKRKSTSPATTRS